MTEKTSDKKPESGIKETIDRQIKSAMKEFDLVESKGLEKTEEVAEAIRKKPLEWVAGAFVAGLILGKLLSKK